MDQAGEQAKRVIRQLTHVARRFAEIEALPIPVRDGVEVSTREAHTIQMIGEHSCMSVTDVSTCFGITKSAASQLVSKLEKKGFLRKQQSAHSNKELRLSLTPLGEEAFEAHEHFHGKDMERMVGSLKTFTVAEISTLTTVLNLVGTIMDERLKNEQ